MYLLGSGTLSTKIKARYKELAEETKAESSS
jgi:hypothetical protein